MLAAFKLATGQQHLSSKLAGALLLLLICEGLVRIDGQGFSSLWCQLGPIGRPHTHCICVQPQGLLDVGQVLLWTS